MKKIYHLSTCSTCKRIINELQLDGLGFEKQDIKHDKITIYQIEQMAELAGSYEALFSRTARKYKDRGFGEKELKEADYKTLILEEYTFLKRPVIIYDDLIFIGNRLKSVDGLKLLLPKN